MRTMREDHFGPEVARSYDEDLAEMFDPSAVEPAVEVLSLLAEGGRALEFAIGTGRIALPLAARGVNVSGIELSEAMIEHLQPGGSFVIEVGVPELRRLPPGERHVVFHADGDSWGIDEYDVAAQGLISHHFHREGHDLRHRAIPFRYVWPAELDLMAQLAGMTLAERWADWHRRPFGHESTSHVSIWRKL